MECSLHTCILYKRLEVTHEVILYFRSNTAVFDPKSSSRPEDHSWSCYLKKNIAYSTDASRGLSTIAKLVQTVGSVATRLRRGGWNLK